MEDNKKDITPGKTLEMKNAARSNKSYTDAAKVILEPGVSRTVFDVVSRYANENGKKNLKHKISKFLIQMKESNTDTIKDESIKKKVKRWFEAGRIPALDRDSAIQMCFGLGLSFSDTEAFMDYLAQDRFHLRDLNDLAFYFVLSYPDLYKSTDENNDVGVYRYQQAISLRDSLLKAFAESTQEHDYVESNILTSKVVDELQKEMNFECDRFPSDSKEAKERLIKFVKEHPDYFGTTNNTAYIHFNKLMAYLGKKVSKDKIENKENDKYKEAAPKSSVEGEIPFYQFGEENNNTYTNILYNLLSKHLIPTDLRQRIEEKRQEERENNEFIEITQEIENVYLNIASFWPDKNSISEMARGIKKVNRKTYILVSLVAGLYELDDSESEGAEDKEISIEDEIKKRESRMNIDLISCGFNPLDPRNPFDWMIIHVISTVAYNEFVNNDQEVLADQEALADQEDLAEEVLKNMLETIYAPLMPEKAVRKNRTD